MTAPERDPGDDSGIDRQPFEVGNLAHLNVVHVVTSQSMERRTPATYIGAPSSRTVEPPPELRSVYCLHAAA